MSSPKWSGKPKRFNPNRNFVMSDTTPTRKFNPKSTFQPSARTGSPSPAVPGVASPQPAAVDLAGLAALGTDALEYASLYHPPLHPLQYHTYAPTPFRAHLSRLEPHERRADDMSLPEVLRKDLEDRNEATLQVLPTSALPEYVHTYHSLVPLDIGLGTKDVQLWGRAAHRYKAISHTDGRTYCLLRLDGFEMSSENEHALQVINKWKRVRSASVACVVEAFTTLAFAEASASPSASAPTSAPASAGSARTSTPTVSSPSTPSSPSFTNSAGSASSVEGQSLVVVYEWHAMSQPLAVQDVKEPQLWSIAVQLFSAIQAVHRRGLACRGVVDENFILFQSHRRVRLGSLGVQDVLQPAAGDSQSDDYRDLGLVLQRLAQKAVVGPQVSEFVSALIEKRTDEAAQILMPYVYRSVDKTLEQVDRLEDSLALELANGRLVRLMAKLDFVLTSADAFHPSNALYPLTLFKQYAFRQRTEQGKPSLNLAHAVAALNKLDAGIDEKVLLVSEDLRSRLVLSYKELKQMVTKAFEDLRKQ